MVAGSQEEVLHGNAYIARLPGASMLLDATWKPKHIAVPWENWPGKFTKAGDPGCQDVKQVCCMLMKYRSNSEAAGRDFEQALCCSA